LDYKHNLMEVSSSYTKKTAPSKKQVTFVSNSTFNDELKNNRYYKLHIYIKTGTSRASLYNIVFSYQKLLQNLKITTLFLFL